MKITQNDIEYARAEVQKMIDTSILTAVERYLAPASQPSTPAVVPHGEPEIDSNSFVQGYEQAIADMLKGGSNYPDHAVLSAGVVRSFVQGLHA